MSYLSSKRYSTDLHEYPQDQDVAPDSKTATEKEDILDTSETTTQLDKLHVTYRSKQKNPSKTEQEKSTDFSSQVPRN
jgi:hypothetical protein